MRGTSKGPKSPPERRGAYQFVPPPNCRHLFFGEFIFAKCWEQGLHRTYGELWLSDGWDPLRDRLQREFGQPHNVGSAVGGGTIGI